MTAYFAWIDGKFSERVLVDAPTEEGARQVAKLALLEEGEEEAVILQEIRRDLTHEDGHEVQVRGTPSRGSIGDTPLTLTTSTTYKCGPGFGTRGETAYLLRQAGRPWSEIVDILQAHSDSAAVKVAKKHAEAHGLAWPIPQPNIEQPEADLTPTALDQVRLVQGEAYDLRAAGESWATIASEISPTTGERRYSAVSHAVAGARRHAEREGRPWPISTATRES